MQVKDLYSEVAKLGFETLLEDPKGFYHAVNRALIQITTVRPEVRSVTVAHEPVANLLNVDAEHSYKHCGGEDLIYLSAVGAKAYSFESDGNGYCYIETLEDGKWNTVADIELNSRVRN